MSQPKKHSVTSPRTLPDWEANCHHVPRETRRVEQPGAGPASQVHLSLTKLGRRADGVQAFATVGVVLTQEEARSHAENILASVAEAEAFDKQKKDES